jgi:phospholipase C
MTVVSPWSRGGWVNSQLYDHTSVIRFIETWKHPDRPFPNISAWRRAACGDLTGCFAFDTAPSSPPGTPAPVVRAAAMVTGLPPARPPSRQIAAVQDPGRRPARPLPYQPSVSLFAAPDAVSASLDNTGSAAACLSGRSADSVRQYTVPAGGSIADSWPAGRYDVEFHGPNRFLWSYAGNTLGPAVHVNACYTPGGDIALTFGNAANAAHTLTVAALQYHRTPAQRRTVPAGTATTVTVPLTDTGGWYDLAVTLDGVPEFHRRFTGRRESGASGLSG